VALSTFGGLLGLGGGGKREWGRQAEHELFQKKIAGKLEGKERGKNGGLEGVTYLARRGILREGGEGQGEGADHQWGRKKFLLTK